jgi:hypothetical protein
MPRSQRAQQLRGLNNNRARSGSLVALLSDELIVAYHLARRPSTRSRA